MSKLWNWIDNRDLIIEVKIREFMILNCLIFSALGFLAWMVISRFALNTLDWAVCFVGYPGFFIGFIGGYIYLCQK